MFLKFDKESLCFSSKIEKDKTPRSKGSKGKDEDVQADENVDCRLGIVEEASNLNKQV